ncbi:MAG: shikimate dehydrogenase [Anaerolineae bacterium]
MLNQETSIYALIGNPVEHSLSHLTHNRAFAKMGLNAVYVKIALEEDELSAFFSLIRLFNLRGLSVTMPLKAALMPYLDETEEELYTAFNTVVCQEERFRGFNTDGRGATDILKKRLCLKGRKILILGAGATAAAMAIEAIKEEADVVLINRTSEKSKHLAHRIGCSAEEMSKARKLFVKGYDVLINATSVGMTPNDDQIPIDPSWLKEGTVVLDAVYAPRVTKLLKAAEEKGCHTIGGAELFAAQAVRQFELWFKNMENCDENFFAMCEDDS